jgi:hypothetical protein
MKLVVMIAVDALLPRVEMAPVNGMKTRAIVVKIVVAV